MEECRPLDAKDQSICCCSCCGAELCSARLKDGSTRRSRGGLHSQAALGAHSRPRLVSKEGAVVESPCQTTGKAITESYDFAVNLMRPVWLVGWWALNPQIPVKSHLQKYLAKGNFCTKVKSDQLVWI